MNRINAQAMNPYEVLGLNPGPVTPESVEKAHRAARKDAHPDRAGGSEEKMSAINQARDILLNPDRKRRFDELDSTGSGPLTMEEQATLVIGTLFAQAVEQAPEGTPWSQILLVMSKELAKGLAKAIDSRDTLPTRLRRAQKILSKIDCDPLLRKIFEKRAEKIANEAFEINNQIALGEMMLKLMQSIKFK